MLIILLAFLPFIVRAHPIHVSVCEMVHNADKHSLDITIKIFADDFEDVLEERTGEDLNIGLGNEHKRTDEFIRAYLAEKFQLTINGKRTAAEFKEKQVEDLAVWCTLSVPDIPQIAIITIRNEIMLHWFRDQVNVVHLDCNDKLKSTYFFPGRIEETFSYK